VKVLVVGAGNIGTTLVNLLLAQRGPLGIDDVLVQKVREPAPFDEPDLVELRRRGARIVRATTAAANAELLASVDYVFDCRKDGAARRDRGRYLEVGGLRGASAQGSEDGFGVPFVGGVNPGAVIGARLVQIASCNTHATATLLAAMAGPALEHLEEADLVCVRRCEDLGGRERLVGASVVSRHRDAQAGTHHAADAGRVFATLGLAPIVTSSDVTTPSQLMHAVRFNLRFRAPRAAADVAADLSGHSRLATTAKFDSNRVFELGRRYGFQGRLYAHAIVVANDLMVSGRTVKGWAFVPQEGNTLLSTLEAFLLQTRPVDAAEPIARRLIASLVTARL
jgi:glyceraldehyde-3-phosphate dehydrogenase (NAD(P))